MLRNKIKDTEVEQFLDLLRADIESSKTATEEHEQNLEDIKRQFMI